MIQNIRNFIFLFILTFPLICSASDLPASKAVGVFLSTGVGPRLPLGQFANSTDLGYGLNIEGSYTDSDHLPFFVFARIGYEQFPGSSDFYQETDYTNYSTTIVPISLGLRYYFNPLAESTVLLIPVIEGSVSYTYFMVLNEFKADSGRNNFKDNLWKFGGTVGAGLSMFILEIMANYVYYESNQYLSVNLSVRLPLFINL
jgi:hypothetical protein